MKSVVPATGTLLRSFLVLLSGMAISVSASGIEKPYAPESIPGVIVIDAEEVVNLILSRHDLLLIDSRKETEYAKGHIEGAVNLLNTSMTRAELERLAPDKDQSIIFYCNGVRCLRRTDAVTRAREWGYRNIFWFRGGWKEWTEKRLPVIPHSSAQ